MPWCLCLSSRCFLEQQTQTVQNFISQLTEAFEIPRITLGGYIFVAGGTFNMMGCKSGKPHRDIMQGPSCIMPGLRT